MEIGFIIPKYFFLHINQTMTSDKKFTTNKIYFIVKNPNDFLEKYKKYIMDTEQVYNVTTFNFAEKDFINIQFLFNVGEMNISRVNYFMNSLIQDNQIKGLYKAFYKFSDKNNDIKLEYKYLYN